MGLFNPRSREEQAHYDYCENTRFQEISEKIKEMLIYIISFMPNL